MIASATASLEAGRRGEALAHYARAMAAMPRDDESMFALGSLALRLNDVNRAVLYLRRAIDHNPEVAAYHLQLGNALLAREQLEEAEFAVRRAIDIAPAFAEAYCNLGCILVRRNDCAAAIGPLQRAVEINPRLASAHQNLGTALFRQGRISDATGSFRHAIANDAHFAQAYEGLGKCLNFLPDVPHGLIAETAWRWSRLLPRPAELAIAANSAEPDRRLRIGYVSADFREHSVAHFLDNVLAAHDRSVLDVLCYSNTQSEDDTTARLKRSADGWRSIVELDDDATATAIRADGIDVLVDLSGHTEGERLAVFARKPAPVQCTWLGYYATTGLPEIDYIIADRFVIPEGHEGFYSEKPYRLPDSYLCFSPPDLPIAVDTLPASRNGFVTFGSCNNVLKINGRVIELWSRLLQAVPAARLVLRTGFLTVAAVREEITRQFAAAGVAAERLDLRAGADRAGLLATYNDIDIALDPFPYGGGTTTAEALWMGVPVVSLRCDRFSGRVGESILTTVGLPALVADDAAAYLATASSLAADLKRLADLRAGLRATVVGSPLCDGDRFARHLRRWCTGREQAA